jgi:gamma-glutamyl:cysteine ligase YbdK (ATP-grasp superfamily)
VTDGTLHLFDAVGVEVEYMIVDVTTLDVLPVCDRLMQAAAGEPASEIERGPIAWSNELVLHVLELKTNGPARELAPLPSSFAEAVSEANGFARNVGGRLMPTAMHPFMDPERETRLWPHEYGEVYRTFDRIFGCRGHGWSNLQSMHINLPFAGDDEFGRLHAAVRVVLPLLPALAASSPFVAGKKSGYADSRLVYYADNCRRLPMVTGNVIPEPCFTKADYEARILSPIAAAIAPFDADGVLDPIWVNARGAIARFDRGSIEIRVLDTQECPLADLALVAVVVALVRGLVEERWSAGSAQRAFGESRLRQQFEQAVKRGGDAPVTDAGYLDLFGLRPLSGQHARATWSELIRRLDGARLLPSGFDGVFETWARAGNLSRRILAALPAEPARADVLNVYRGLSECLENGVLFEREAP